MIDRSWRDISNILAVRLDNLGDVLLATPAIHAIRRAIPLAKITLLASPVGAQVASLCPDIDAVIEYDAPWVDPWQTLPLDPARDFALIDQLSAERFDAAIIFTSFRQSPLPAAQLCYLAGIQLRLGATTDGAGSLLTTRHKHGDQIVHEVVRGWNLIGAVGIENDGTGMMLDVPSDVRCGAESAWRGWAADRVGRPRIVVHPGCSMPARTYPGELFAEAIDELVRDLGATVAVTGSATESELVAKIGTLLDPQTRNSVRLVAGKLTFAQFAATIATADLTLTNNTGPMHLSAAVKTPVAALFALTNPPEQWRPWGVAHRLLYHDVDCRICFARICPLEQECLRRVTPLEIVATVDELLLESRSSVASTHGRAVR
jgi:ADP-heptose:LPS heptosyltransferase